MTSRSSIPLALFLVLTLASCGPQTIEGACFRNADHEKYSDNKINRMCTCVSNKLDHANLSTTETGWAVAILKGDSAEGLAAAEMPKYHFVSNLVSSAKRDCSPEK